MSENQIEKEFNGKVIDFVSFVNNYFKTAFNILLHPRKTIIKKNSVILVGPGAFLTANILITYAIGAIGGYNMFDDCVRIPWINNLFGELSFVLLRYIFGFLLFLSIIMLFMGFRKSDGIVKLFSILCYSSIIYIPHEIIKILWVNFMSEDLIDVLTRILSSPSSTFDYVTILKDVFLLIVPPSVFYVWWLVLLYLNLKNQGKSKTRTKISIVLAVFVFVGLQLFSIIISDFIQNESVLEGIKTIYTSKIEKEIQKAPPNYYKALILARDISDNELMPENIRYVYALRKISYNIAIPMFNNNKKLVSIVTESLKQRSYVEVERILEENHQKLCSDLNLEKELELIKKYRNSPDYIDLSGKTVRFIFAPVDTLEPLSPDYIFLKDEIIGKLPVVFSHKALISIFPLL